MSGISFHDYHPCLSSLRQEVLAGLVATPKVLPPKLFYDYCGAQLFERICELPEYYLTRAEVTILKRHAAEIAVLASYGSCLLELGSGAGVKVRLLLEHLRPTMYVPIDISRTQLCASAKAMAQDYTWLAIHPVCADYCQPLPLDFIPEVTKRLVFFPGSTLGNFEPEEAKSFLENLRGVIREEGSLLISIDLKKEPTYLHAAYNDKTGITAAFNLNILNRLQRDLDAEVDSDGFHHQAFYNHLAGRVEMHLISRRQQAIVVGDRTFYLDEGETIHTENSYKYSIEEFQDLATQAGYRPLRVWTDPDTLFSVHFLQPG